jgi:hypothetical protein
MIDSPAPGRASDSTQEFRSPVYGAFNDLRVPDQGEIAIIIAHIAADLWVNEAAGLKPNDDKPRERG